VTIDELQTAVRTRRAEAAECYRKLPDWVRRLAMQATSTADVWHGLLADYPGSWPLVAFVTALDKLEEAKAELNAQKESPLE
jgi:hypothetical protein